MNTAVPVPQIENDTESGRSTGGPPRLLALAIDGIVSFTAAALKVWSYIGFAVAVAAFAGCYGLFIILRTLFFGADVAGYASLLVATLFMNGLDVLGEDMARRSPLRFSDPRFPSAMRNDSTFRQGFRQG